MKGYVKRSLIWSVPFYGIAVFAVCYLKDKAEIRGADVLLILIPMLFFGFSSESFSKLVPRRLRPLGVVDFCVKTVAYVLLVLPLSVPSANKYWILRLVFICVLFAVSTVTDILLIKLYDKFKDQVFDEEQPDAATVMSLKELGRLNVFSGLGTFCPLLGGFLVLYFGYTPAFFILGIPLLAIGIGSLAYRTFILVKNGNDFAKLPKIIADNVLSAAVIVLSMVFTSARIVETETGFTITHDVYILEAIGYAILYIGTLAVHAHTNRKTAIAYLKRRNKMKNEELF